MEERTLSIIIPAYNEEDTIEQVVSCVSTVTLPVGWKQEIIVVDDGSTDDTAARLEKVKEHCTIVSCNKNGGKGNAIKEGLRHATGDYIITQDADMEYDPHDYCVLLEPIIKGQASVVFGSRVLGGNTVSFNRVFYHGGLILTKLFNLLFGTELTDVATCYKIFPGKYRQELGGLPAHDFVFDFVELSNFLISRHRVVEVPIRYSARGNKQGKKLKFRHGFRIFISMIRLYVQKNRIFPASAVQKSR